tara:strand:- start:498 stop:929 length:432 start_codon:yes stop_codon:yes gene_type:complete
MKEKINIQNITIIILLLVVIVLLVEPKLNTNTISEISNEITSDSTTVDDSLTMRAFLLEKGYTEKEIELIENKESLEKKMDGEIGRYQISSVDGFSGPDAYQFGSFVVLDTKTGDMIAVRNPYSYDFTAKDNIKKINLSYRFK